MSKSNITVGLVAIVALILAGLAYTKTPERIVGSQGPQGERGIQGPKGDQGPVGPRGPAGSPAPRVLGALTGPDINYPYINVNGVKREPRGGITLGAATTTFCSIQSPTDATSTPRFWSMNITTATGTAMTFDLATSTDRFSTSTLPLLKQVSLAANAKGAFSWFPTSATTTNGVYPGINSTTGQSQLILAPGTWLNVKSSPGLGGYTYGGTCQAEFLVI